MSAVLAVDLGKTSCRAALWADAGSAPLLANGQGAPGLADRAGGAAAERAILAVCGQLPGELPPLLSLCVGAAGAAAAGEAADLLVRRLGELLPVDQVAVCSDSIIAHAGALGGRPGVLLLAGTGAVVIALAQQADGLIQVDGWGPLLGDAGGGGWIGLRGLSAALRAIDGRGPATLLEQAAVAQFGELPGLPAHLGQHDNPARLAASFAPVVARLAEDGDPVARTIMNEAGHNLAESVLAGIGRLAAPPDRIAIAGGLWKLGAALLQPLEAALRLADPPLRITPAVGDPLSGGRLLATRRDTVHEPYIHRCSVAQ
ncbi:MAG: ATPase [Actinomycetota bacterium]|nr:ATPase [Actinomycetota bacterium]MDQ2956481.1 ATPase [Actinomycetota bacterium]